VDRHGLDRYVSQQGLGVEVSKTRQAEAQHCGRWWGKINAAALDAIRSPVEVVDEPVQWAELRCAEVSALFGFDGGATALDRTGCGLRRGRHTGGVGGAGRDGPGSAL